VTRESWNGFDLETERRLRASMADNGRPPNMSVMAADEEQS
jgi:hypothetical protein